MAKANLTATRLRELFIYNPDDGTFIRRVDCGQIKAGTSAGGIDSLGYLAIRIDGRLYRCHRLAWLYVTGEWPNQLIDHLDGIRTNNRFQNLRDGSRRLNQENMHRPMKNNTTGFLGVHYHKAAKKYEAFINIHGKKKYLGLFQSAEMASDAYLRAKREFHDGCTI